MTVTKKESESIQKFVCALLRDEADLSTLTIGVLKRRYLAHVGGDSLSSEAQRLIKEVVKRELVKMQDKDSKTEFETRIPSQKRKRENVSDDEGTGSEAEDESSAKKYHQSGFLGSSSESKDRISTSENAKKESAKRKQKKKNKISSDESEDDEHTGVQAGSKAQVSSEDSDEDKPNNSKKKSDKTKEKTRGLTKNSQVSGEKSENDRRNKRQTKQMDETKQRTDETSKKEVSNDGDQMDFEAGPAKKKTNTARKEQVSSDDSENEEINKSDSGNAKKSNIQSSGTSKEEQMSSDDSEDEDMSEGQSKQKLKETPQSENEDDSAHPEEIDKDDDSSSADSEKENVSREKDQEPDSDSSSLPSLEDKTEYKREVKEKDKVTKKKTVEKKEKTTNRKKEENKSVVRLKHYISLCGARHNYKKMLDGCHTIASKVGRLKKALEELGVEGPPTIKKCKKVKMQREEAREIAELDTSNIITLHGRPKRRATLPWHEQKEPPSSTYQHTLDSGSDSDQQKSHNIKRRTNWTNLQGIISDDAESD